MRDFMTHAGIRCEQGTYQSLRKQGPENDTGSFDPVRVHPILRSPSAYSLSYAEPVLRRWQASRVPISGRACDTTTMHATQRRTTTAERIKNPRHVHPVHPRRNRVDAKNRQTAECFLNHVQASTPKCNVRLCLTEDNPELSTVKIKEICRLGWTLGRRFKTAFPSCEYLRPPKSAMGGRGGHLSGEVIL